MNFTGTKPIFEQIADYYEKLIVLGVYHDQDYLPSVREVALENKINPNTVVHAYSLLVDKGLIQSIPKKGYQVKGNGTSYRKDELKKEILKLVASGYTYEEIKDEIDELQGGHVE